MPIRSRTNQARVRRRRERTTSVRFGRRSLDNGIGRLVSDRPARDSRARRGHRSAPAPSQHLALPGAPSAGASSRAGFRRERARRSAAPRRRGLAGRAARMTRHPFGCSRRNSPDSRLRRKRWWVRGIPVRWWSDREFITGTERHRASNGRQRNGRRGSSSRTNEREQKKCGTSGDGREGSAAAHRRIRRTSARDARCAMRCATTNPIQTAHRVVEI